MANSFFPFHLCLFNLFVDFLVEHPSEMCGFLELLNCGFKEFRHNFYDERSVCGIVAVLINIAVHVGRCHPVVGDYEVYFVLLGPIVGVACGLSRSALTSETIIADVGTPFFIDEGQCGGKELEAPVQVTHEDLSPGSMASN